MAIALSPNKTVFNGGIVAANGTLRVYQTGTTTFVTIYNDGALTSPAANPITLDVNGSAIFYVGATVDIKYQYYTSAGILINTEDPVYVVPDLTSLSSIASLNSGGFLNLFRNANFEIMQRGSSGSVTTGNANYTMDGWILGATGATVTWANALPPINPTALGSYQCLAVNGNTGMTDTFLRQRIESWIAARMYGGQSRQVTVQITVQNATGSTITPTLTVRHAGGVDNWTSPVTDVAAVALQPVANGVTATLAYTFATVAGTNNGLEVTWDFANSLNNSSKALFFNCPDIRVTSGTITGLNNLPPTPELKPYPTELAICQRYLPAFQSAGVTSYLAQGSANATISALINFIFPVTTRIPTTGITITSPTHISLYDGVNIIVATTIGLAAVTNYVGNVLITVASGLTQFRPYFLYLNNASDTILFTGAEL